MLILGDFTHKSKYQIFNCNEWYPILIKFQSSQNFTKFENEILTYRNNHLPKVLCKKVATSENDKLFELS